MAYTVRVSLPGYNALTEAGIKNYSLYADSDNVLIKEHSRGSSDVASNATVTHNIGYIPFFIVMGKVSSTTWEIVSTYSGFGGGWRSYTSSTTLYLSEGIEAYDDYQYYIFYDEF